MKIVITGVTRGLGRALAEWYLANGHTVAGCGRNGPAIFDLRFAHSEPNSFDALDVTQAVKVGLWAERVLGLMGPPDFLINNAALINSPASLWKVPAAEFEKVISVNIVGVANVIRAFAPAMVERRSGVIVNMSSGWGRSVSPDVAPYCTTKWAIAGMTKALAEELPKGMAAVALSPGTIDTDMLRICFSGSASSYQKPAEWVKKAAPYILGLGATDNGRSASVEGAGD
jgi:NAD(P)-dependent dehydrogenase (short-subunit alcohol dehydrogenase family)